MFRRKEEKRIVELKSKEVHLLIVALTNYRNKAMKAGKPAEDINDLLLRIVKY